MRLRLTLAMPLLLELHRRTATEEAVDLRAGLGGGDPDLEVLLPFASATTPPSPAGRTASVRVFRLAPGLEGISHLYWHAFPPPRRLGLHVELGLQQGRGCSAAAFAEGRILPIDEVRVMGPFLERWVPGSTPGELRGDVPLAGPYSRYVGALGGRAVHARLRRLQVLGIGAARLGSALATALARAGVGKQYLVDPDRLEEHSEDAVECLPGRWLGAPKVEAVADWLRWCAPTAAVVPLPVKADAASALAACRDSDLVFSAPDRDDARFAAALLATAFHRVHLDLGTGVFDDDGSWRAGADVRLILPTQGCLCCIGGLDLQASPPADWRRQRAGSLRSLNHLAVSAGMLLLERLVAGDVERSTWLRLEVASDGSIATRRMPAERDPRCALCSRWAGAGDSAFELG